MRYKWEKTIENAKKHLGAVIYTQFTDSLYDIVVSQYTKNRYYHDMSHIDRLLNYIDDFDVNMKERTMLEIAVWFHDIVYVPQIKYNEELSTDMCDVFTNGISLDKRYIDIITNLILVTKHDDTVITQLEKIMVDLDLKDLGDPIYWSIGNLVRKEFEHLSEEEWKKGRVIFLKKMIQKDYIFMTKEYRTICEKESRINLQKEIELLVGE